MIRSRSLLLSAARGAACLLLLNVSVPLGAVTTVGKPVVDGLKERADLAKAEAAERARREKRRAKSRPLTAKEQRTEQGRSGPNPYLAGQSKWDVVYKGVNLMTGAYTSGGTDLSFDGGYGIPVNVTRAYNSNTVDEGPFGRGWTLSADARSTAGGMLKSPGSPVRTVPSSFKERPSIEQDPNLPVIGGPQGSQGGQPVEAVVATDASGEEETIQKDADGVLTTPPWDKNVIDSTYETLVKADGAVYQLLTANTVKTPDGTTYRYTKQGAYGTWNATTKTYTGGTRPWNNSSTPAEPANVLKVVEATDRQGNLTTYTYGSGWVTFAKMNGTTTEHPLVRVEMPNGHKINFTWGNGTAAPANRIVDIDDGLANVNDRRHVVYTYNGAGNLASVTTPGGKTTGYGYSGSYLTSITDPRGYVEGIAYDDAWVKNLPWGGAMDVTAVSGLSHANGTSTVFSYLIPNGTTDVAVAEKIGTTWLSDFYLKFTPGGASSPTLTVKAGTLGQGYIPAYTATGPMLPAQVLLDQNLSTKTYHAFTQDLTSQWDQWLVHGEGGSSAQIDSRFQTANRVYGTGVETTYNFQGQPLSQTTYEKGPCYTMADLNAASGNPATLGYAYWGRDKYWQRKAVKDHAGRVSFTDYYDESASGGRKGQTKEVYDEKYSDWDGNGSNWRYTIVPKFTATYASVPVAQFDYDAKGRPIWVDKLRSVALVGTNQIQTGTFVRTATTYGADTDGSWGQPTLVTEDVGGINRTTQTLAYSPQGKATMVRDARSNSFSTAYLPDGEVSSITHTSGPGNTPGSGIIATYAYGGLPGTGGTANTPTAWAAYGQLKSVTDHLSGITQSFTYGYANGEKGQVVDVTETDSNGIGGSGIADYSVDYDYWPSGERARSLVVSNGHTEAWEYADYVAVGDPTAQSRVFRTMRRLTETLAYTPEEEHFLYDVRGRLTAAAFAQSPYRNAQGQPYETNGTAPYLLNAEGSAGMMASARCVAEYERDAAGRVKNLVHRWESRTST
ncbi:hypothetical protein EON79_00565, partial [bacterium]